MGKYFLDEGRWALWIVCACYLIVVYITCRGLIAAPRYRLLQARIGDCRARVAVLTAALAAEGSDPSSQSSPQPPPASTSALAAVTGRLDELDRNGQVVWRLLRRHWVLAIPLSKLASAWRTLHEAETRLLRLEGPEEVALRARGLRLRLAADPGPVNDRIAGELAEHAGDAAAERAILVAATERIHDTEDGDFEREYELQRTALWLALTGLGAVLLTGLVFDHRLSMLAGGLGGFLSPLVGVMRAQRPSSWGVLVLAPVGGALAAPGGLLLVRMLADPELNLLGQVFLENSWGAPTRPISLAIALLFGFSGTLFSRLALAATGQLAPAPARTPQTSGVRVL
ncbi:hypothetical protein ACFY8W_26345 [Streptomyces sp. NPDC012637]|uniref:hypothetical protein n=1 Tax=Streptomyces sp. NPDC012637 TaxID=3364842 RepID=UPI0036E378EE